MYFVRFLAGYVRLFGDASIRRLKPLLGKGCQTNSLPTGLNRISWKQLTTPLTSHKKTGDPTDWVKSD
ncbi:hypothetical protein [Coleofasciculus sp. E1-EBD-02]|uniref:hypothetical protein n=1 Tax=Coleofasciculus sp. E1-EBD-02 TaxID=3068481 RepID=UPI004064834E